MAWGPAATQPGGYGWAADLQDSAPILFQTEGNGSHPKDADDSALWKAVRYVQMCRPQADFYCTHDNKRPYLEVFTPAVRRVLGQCRIPITLGKPVTYKAFLLELRWMFGRRSTWRMQRVI